jgi:2-polyprenyl-3-methyl-5-hydroxy-6-metoxy-1,4-benzoquinol methylase
MDLGNVSYVGNRQPFLQRLATGKSVLHLGCTGSPCTEVRIQREESMHMKLLKVSREVYGIDLDPTGIAIMRDKYQVPNLYRGSVERLQDVALDGLQQFDLVLAAEIIEHLSRPGDMIEGIKRFMRADSRLLISTPNPLSLKYFLHAMRGKEVQGPDHTLMLSPQTGTHLFQNRHGFRIARIHSCLEAHASFLNRTTRPLFSSLFRMMPWYADGLIFELELAPHA